MEASTARNPYYLHNKLVLGASSWGNDYGISNEHGIGSQEISQILRAAHEAGIVRIDTSPDYGDSEKLIGLHLASDFGVYSKVSPESWSKGFEQATLVIQESLQRLRIKKLEGVMFHSSSSIFEYPEESVRFMKHVVDFGLAREWGVSVYDIDEVERLLSICKPDFIQLPSSIVDRRFADSGIISQLFAESIDVHTRSIFLQGLILQEPAKLSRKFKRLSIWADEFENFSTESGLSKYHLSLLYNLTNPKVSKVLVGVNSLAHFGQALEALDKPLRLPDFDLLPPLDDIEVIDPRRWQS